MSRLSRAVEIAVSLVAALLVVAACASPAKPGPTASPTQPAPPVKAASPSQGNNDWTAEWDTTLSAARKEAKVTVIGPAGDVYRTALEQGFQAAFPDIKVSYFGGKAAEIGPKITAERKAEMYLWDVFVGGGNQARDTLLKPGYLEPLRSALIMPEVQEDSDWVGGFADGFNDAARQYIYRFGTDLAPVAYVNRRLAPKSELDKIDGLLDAKWKGKIGMRPASAGYVRNSLGIQLILRGNDGEPWLRKFLAQDIKILEDERMLMEGLVRGSYAIAVGITVATMEEYVRQGLGGDIEALEPESPLGASIAGGNSYVALFKNPPNPSGQKIYVNWLLSRAGQQVFEDKTANPTRRLDTQASSPALRVKPGDRFVAMDREDVAPVIDRVLQLMQEMPK